MATTTTGPGDQGGFFAQGLGAGVALAVVLDEHALSVAAARHRGLGDQRGGPQRDGVRRVDHRVGDRADDGFAGVGGHPQVRGLAVRFGLDVPPRPMAVVVANHEPDLLGLCVDVEGGQWVTGTTEDTLAQGVEFVGVDQAAGECAPARQMLGQCAGGLLGGAGAVLGAAADLQEFLGRRLVTVLDAEGDDALRAVGLDLPGTLRKTDQQLVRHPDQLPHRTLEVHTLGGPLCPVGAVVAEQVPDPRVVVL